jgi:hypothetical protein
MRRASWACESPARSRASIISCCNATDGFSAARAISKAAWFARFHGFREDIIRGTYHICYGQFAAQTKAQTGVIPCKPNSRKTNHLQQKSLTRFPVEPPQKCSTWNNLWNTQMFHEKGVEDIAVSTP